MNKYAKFEPSHAARMREKHEPMSTLAELAEQFGTTPSQLGKMLVDKPGAPAPFKTAGVNYYPRKSMRTWYYGGAACDQKC